MKFDLSIYMTDDELMKMDNLITSIKEETRSLSVGGKNDIRESIERE